MASITKRGNSYKITVSCGYDASGKQIRKHMTWTPDPNMTVRQIEKELKRQEVLFEEQVKAGTLHDGNIRFEDFADEWMTEYAEKQLKIKTVDGYKKLLPSINAAIGHIKLKDLRTGHLNSSYSNLQEEGMRNDTKCSAKVDIKKLMIKRNITQALLARKSGLKSDTVKKATQGHNINLESAEAIAEVLKMKRIDLFKDNPKSTTLSPNTVRAYHRLTSSILSKAVKWSYIPYNPATNAELPKLENKEAKHLDEDDARRLLVLLHDEPIKYRAMITFDLLSGLRRGELLGLRWQDIDFENETIKIVQTSSYVPSEGVYTDTPKNATSSRPLKLSRVAFIMLREYQDWQDKQREVCGDFWKDKDNRVFTTDDGAPIHPDSITSWFSDFVKRSELPPVSVHSLRHTYASLMIADGTPLVIVSRRLGHAQVSTTANIYAHAIASADEKAAQVVDKFADVVAPENDIQQKSSDKESIA